MGPSASRSRPAKPGCAGCAWVLASFSKIEDHRVQGARWQKFGTIARTDHREWYRELFETCVVSGLIPASALAGYRNDAIYLRKSRYVPPRWETVRDAMTALFDLLDAEPESSVRAVLGHWLSGYTRPYPDSNGRMARFLMNVLLASGRYPRTVVCVEDRAEYLKALDRASIDADAKPFARFIVSFRQVCVT